MAVDDKYEILQDEKGSYYIYIDRRGIKWKTRVRETVCLTCGRKMYQIFRNGKGIQQYCSWKCRPVKSGYKRDKKTLNMSGLEFGRAWNKGLKNYLSEETIKKMSDAHIGKLGEMASNWKGGFKNEDYRIRRRKEYTDWRKSVFERDNYVCQQCGIRGKYLNAHHKKSFKNYPELRYDLNNGITLCLECHKLEHKKMRSLNG